MDKGEAGKDGHKADTAANPSERLAQLLVDRAFSDIQARNLAATIAAGKARKP
jgi:hypothetical protein